MGSQGEGRLRVAQKRSCKGGLEVRAVRNRYLLAEIVISECEIGVACLETSGIRGSHV